MREQRKYIRYESEGSISLKIGDDNSPVIKTELFDISFMGIGLYSPVKIEVNTLVQFELMTKLSDEPLTGKGIIRHVTELKKDNDAVFRMGIEFTEVDKENMVCLINKIQEKICAEARSTEPTKKSPFRY